MPVIFFINGVQGGNSEFGTIDSNGLYTAPAIVPVPNTVAITTTTAKFPNDPPGAVAIGILNPIPVLTSVTPTGLSEGTTMVTVGGSQFVYGAQIVWNGKASPPHSFLPLSLLHRYLRQIPAHSISRKQSGSRLGHNEINPRQSRAGAGCTHAADL